MTTKITCEACTLFRVVIYIGWSSQVSLGGLEIDHNAHTTLGSTAQQQQHNTPVQDSDGSNTDKTGAQRRRYSVRLSGAI